MNLSKVGKSIFLKKKTKILIVGTGRQAEIFLNVFVKNKIQIDRLLDIVNLTEISPIKLTKKL